MKNLITKMWEEMQSAEYFIGKVDEYSEHNSFLASNKEACRLLEENIYLVNRGFTPMRDSSYMGEGKPLEGKGIDGFIWLALNDEPAFVETIKQAIYTARRVEASSADAGCFTLADLVHEFKRSLETKLHEYQSNLAQEHYERINDI
jgi:hypothetical protein